MYTPTNSTQPIQTVPVPMCPQYMPPMPNCQCQYAAQPNQMIYDTSSLYAPAPTERETDTFDNPLCMRALIERYIGKIVRAQFHLGEVLHEHVGRLMSVGPSYLVIEALKERVITICDLYSVKFVTVMLDEEETQT